MVGRCGWGLLPGAVGTTASGRLMVWVLHGLVMLRVSFCGLALPKWPCTELNKTRYSESKHCAMALAKSFLKGFWKEIRL